MRQSIRGWLGRHYVALIALFVALSGTAYAATQIGPSDIRVDAVRAKHIKDGQVKSAEVLDDTLTAGDIDEATLNLPQIVSGRVQPDPFGQQTVVDAGGVRIRASCGGAVGLVMFQNTTGFPARVIEVEGGNQVVGNIPSDTNETTLEETAGRARVIAQVAWGQNLEKFTTFTVLYDRPGGCPAEAWGQAVTTTVQP